MNDDCVILLEKVLAENARLRETIEARDVEHRRALQEINPKLDKENTSDAVMSQAKSGRKTARKVQISHECRQDFRKMYKTLAGDKGFKGFVVGKRFSAEENRTAVSTVIEAVLADHSGDKCPWTRAELKASAATYFKSLKDTAGRAAGGTLQAHIDLCRKQGRMRDKIERRLSVLQQMPWSPEKKAEIRKAIGMKEYISSEDEEGNRRLSAYLIKKLPWERSALTNVKKTLDEAYVKNLNRRARVNLVARRAHRRPSTRGPPKEGIAWAVRPAQDFTSPAAPMSSSSSTEAASFSARPSVTASSGTRSPVTPSSGTRRPVTPSSSIRPPVTPSSSVRPLVTPSSGTRPPVTPSSSIRPLVRPSTSTRPPVTPSSGTKPPVTPSSGTRPLVTPLSSTRSPATPLSATRPPVTPSTSGTRASPRPKSIPRNSSTTQQATMYKKKLKKLKSTTLSRSPTY